jgi:hypothetical protein
MDLRGRITHPAGQCRVLYVNDEDAVAAGRSKQRPKTRPGFGVHGQVDPKLAEDAVFINEVALHIDEEKRGVRGIDEFGKLSEDALSLDLDH